MAMAYLMVGATWVAGVTAFTILVLNDKPWWGAFVLILATLPSVKTRNEDD